MDHDIRASSGRVACWVVATDPDAFVLTFDGGRISVALRRDQLIVAQREIDEQLSDPNREPYGNVGKGD